MNDLRHSVAVVGPGAIGGALAGALIQVGATPAICGRTGFSRLIVDHPGGTISSTAECRTAPVDGKPVEMVIVAVKAHQTADAAAWLAALVGPTTTVVVAQNGVEHIERLRPLIPAGAAVVPAVVWCPAERSAPGRIVVTGPATLVVPSGDGGRRLADLLDGSFFGVRLSDDFTTRAWDKLLINAALGGLGALTGRAGSDLATEPVLRDLMLRLMVEIVAVARAEGADIPDDRPEQVLDRVVTAGAGHLSSIAVDRKLGLPTEWDARNAVVGRIAARHGLEAPLNEWLTAMIRFGEPQFL